MIVACASRSCSSMPSPTDRTTSAVAWRRWSAPRAGANLIAFAELAFEPFHPQRPASSRVRDLAETVPGPLTDRISQKARELGVITVLNLYERDGDRAYDCSP